jgi:crotonobetainyl-CoA:carnitine CoA-transferase CaiB-like acyl-CoA transferase
VLDLGQIWAGPYAATLLADQGADVIKVESPSAWDPNRCAAPPPAGREAEYWNTCAYFHEYSRNKRSLALDLRTPRGRELLGRLVASADVVIENLRADVLDRLGVGYDWLRLQRSDVILVSMAGFGKSGPESALPGYGPMIESLAGIASLTGYADGQPRMASGYAYGDPVGAVAAACAVLVALQVRARTGRGQHVDLAQRDVMAALIGEAFVMDSRGEAPVQRGNERPGCAPHGVYPARGEDDWVAIAVMRDDQWQALRGVLGDPAWARAPELARAAVRFERRAELDGHIAAWTRELDKREVFARCRAAGVPAGPVYKPLELIEDPQLVARGFYERIAHPAVGEWRIHGWAWRPRGAGACMRSRGPDFGGHNREVLREIGLGEAEIAELERQGVIASRPQNLPSLG